jgi:anti-anti-sigma regulatory factor
MRELLIELSGVPLLDAAGIATLVAVHEAARVRGVGVEVTGLQPYAAQLVAASGLQALVQGRTDPVDRDAVLAEGVRDGPGRSFIPSRGLDRDTVANRVSAS